MSTNQRWRQSPDFLHFCKGISGFVRQEISGQRGHTYTIVDPKNWTFH